MCPYSLNNKTIFQTKWETNKYSFFIQNKKVSRARKKIKEK